MARVLGRSQRRRDDYEGLWFVTFADLMVQLMAFFAVIYSYSNQDQRKLQAVLNSMRTELGLEGEGVLPGGAGLDPARAADLEKLVSDLKPSEGPDEGVRMRIVSFRGGILFPEGATALDATFQPMLGRIAEMVQEYPGFTLVCEGHAAPGERARGRDALDLSGQRAQAVVRYLNGRGVDPRILAAEAHGDAAADPAANAPEARALQRCVRFRFQRVASRDESPKAPAPPPGP